MNTFGWRLAFIPSLAILSAIAQAGDILLEIPSSPRTLHLSLPRPAEVKDKGIAIRLVGIEAPDRLISTQLGPEVGPNGAPEPGKYRILASVAPGGAEEPRRYRLQSASPEDSRTVPRFRFDDADDRGLRLWEGSQPVFVYNHGVRSHDGVPPARNRSTYLHPIYGLDGEILTDDFPEDHHHHRGLFWAWPHVVIEGREYDLWLLGSGLEQRFERWLARDVGPVAAILGIENGWYVGDRKVMEERIWFTVHPAETDERAMDVSCFWKPVDRPITLAGAEGKSYGGMTLRFAPRTETTITTPQGSSGDDLLITRLPWADLTARFGRSEPSGAAVFVSPDHPDFPPEWLTRHYGVLCVGWPGVTAQTLEPGVSIQCRYRVWIHRGTASVERIQNAYDAYLLERDAAWR